MSLINLSYVGETALITFQKPPANAIDLPFTDAFRDCLEKLAAAPPKGGLVIAGDGRSFSGGVDFKAAPQYSQDEKRRMVGNISRIVTQLYTLPTATVAAVNGHAIGGGLVLALACDFRLFAQVEAKFGLTEVSAGIPYPAGPMEVLKAELSQPALRQLVLSGKIFGVSDALSFGIADEIILPNLLVEEAISRAQEMASLASYAVVKNQLKHDTANRLREIVETQSDPMLEHWV